MIHRARCLNLTRSCLDPNALALQLGFFTLNFAYRLIVGPARGAGLRSHQENYFHGKVRRGAVGKRRPAPMPGPVQVSPFRAVLLRR